MCFIHNVIYICSLHLWYINPIYPVLCVHFPVLCTLPHPMYVLCCLCISTFVLCALLPCVVWALFFSFIAILHMLYLSFYCWKYVYLPPCDEYENLLLCFMCPLMCVHPLCFLCPFPMWCLCPPLWLMCLHLVLNKIFFSLIYMPFLLWFIHCSFVYHLCVIFSFDYVRLTLWCFIYIYMCCTPKLCTIPLWFPLWIFLNYYLCAIHNLWCYCPLFNPVISICTLAPPLWKMCNFPCNTCASKPCYLMCGLPILCFISTFMPLFH